MGVVLKGRDTDLGHDLAVKVLLDRHGDDPAMVCRFIEEAQIAGQLQRPGVVPVYKLGCFDGQRPYFAMKLVKGRTLAKAEGPARTGPTGRTRARAHVSPEGAGGAAAGDVARRRATARP